MREVRKQNITNSIFTLLILCVGMSISAQYSPTFIGDSIKFEVLKQHKSSIMRTTFIDASVNRNQMPIFCKWELDIEDYTKIPVKFRLGSQDAVDRMENKGPTTVKN